MQSVVYSRGVLFSLGERCCEFCSSYFGKIKGMASERLLATWPFSCFAGLVPWFVCFIAA